tara:strand:- start:1135 stop:2562 length:1428 start_codon:yes stop_codon:yes gene_type:complete
MFLYLFIVIKASLFLITVIFVYHKIKLYKFDGPFAIPLFGNLYTRKAFKTISYIKECREKYGKIFLFWSGLKPMIVVCEPEIVRSILSDTHKFEKGEDYTEKFSFVFGNGLVTSNGDKHKTSKRCLSRFFVKNKIDYYTDTICKMTNQMIEEKLENNLNKPFDIQDFFHILSLRIFGKFSLNIDYSEDKNIKVAEEINQDVKKGSNLIGKHIIMNIPMFPFLESVKKLDKMVKNIDKHISNVIESRKKGENESRDDILNQLIYGDKEDVFHQIRTLLSAGHDTTAFFGCYMVYLLSHNQNIQDKIKKEIREVLNGREKMTNLDIDKMEYCKMVILETLRLYTIIPFITRKCKNDYKIKNTNLVIPKNSTVLIPLTVMNRDVSNWDNPNTFFPERFKDVNGLSIPKKGFLPFGYGMRTCIGNTLAIREAIIMLGSIMQRYRILPDSNFKPKIIAGISLISQNGINVILKKELISQI